MIHHSFERKVLIIGAGPTGMVAALCLNQLGVDCVVIERQAGLKDHPKAHELSGRSMEILQSLGVSEAEMAAEASSYEDACRVVFCDTLGVEYGVIDLSESPSAKVYREALTSQWPFLNLSQVELEKVLLRHVLAAERVQLLWSHQWESFTQHDDHVRSQVTNRITGESLVVHSDFVLCADGAGSRSRNALGIQMQGPESLRDFVNAYFEVDLSEVVKTRGKLYFSFNPEAMGAAFIAHRVDARWVLNVALMPGRREEDCTDEFLIHLGHTLMGRKDIPLTVRSRSRWRMTAQVADGFRSGRAFLIGDAAHRFPPTGGLGMNSGIADAHNLCWKIAAVLRGDAADALLDTYEQERRPVVQRNCDESRVNFERLMDVVRAFGLDPERAEAALDSLESGPLSQLPRGSQNWLRRWAIQYGASVLNRFHTDPAVRRQVKQAIADQRPHFDRIGLELGYAYAEGALFDDGSPPPANDDPVSTYVPTTRPGARFPHFWLDGNLRQRSSHALLRPGWSSLILGEMVPGDPAALEAFCVAHRLELHRLTPAPACREWAHRQCEIERDGALLVRPDGHVAWRERSDVLLSKALLRSILEQCWMKASPKDAQSVSVPIALGAYSPVLGEPDVDADHIQNANGLSHSRRSL
ncbi:MAG: FAD-dependent monooxygenase [Myxococcota bacterium]